MNPVLMLTLLVVAPVVILTVLRVNAAVAFVALCLGSVLSSFVADDLQTMLRGYVAPDAQTTTMVISLVLLWLPVAIILCFTLRTIAPKQRLRNLLPCVAVGLLGVLLSVPLLASSTQAAIASTTVWGYINHYQSPIVVLGTIVSLLYLTMRATSITTKEPRKSKR